MKRWMMSATAVATGIIAESVADDELTNSQAGSFRGCLSIALQRFIEFTEIGARLEN